MTKEERLARIKKPAQKAHSNYNGFSINNWIRPGAEENDLIKEIDSRGGALWMEPDGTIRFRRSPDEQPLKLPMERAKITIANFTDRSKVTMFNAGKDAVPDLVANEIRMATDRFSPHVTAEFYEENGMIYRTAWRPTPYLLLQPGEYREPKNILMLLRHLVNGNEERYRWMVNWLAGFFQTLKRSQVALVLRGPQGAGKGILVNEIVAPLLGKPFVIVVDEERLKTSFKSWIDGRLFYNLNEVAHDPKGRKNLSGFLKMLVTDESIHTEEKFERAKETIIYGNLLVTSNATAPLEVEPSDRRYTIYQTGPAIKRKGWKPLELIEGIRGELHDFAVMLKSWPVDWDLYNTAQETPEKSAIVNATNDRFSVFLAAVKSRDISYFASMLDDGELADLEEIFTRGDISPKELTHLFNQIGDDEEDIGSRTLMKKLRNIDPIMFELGPNRTPVRGRKVMGERYYRLGD
jgi:hypothetical protein